MNGTRYDELGKALMAQPDFWAHWGFEPWEQGAFTGVCRLQRFVKDGLLGPVAEYRAWDCIVWAPGTAQEREALWKAARPIHDVMTQRFVFLLDCPWPKRRIRSFWLGLSGYIEFYAFDPLKTAATSMVEPKDLTDLVRLAMRVHEQTNTQGTGTTLCETMFTPKEI